MVGSRGGGRVAPEQEASLSCPGASTEAACPLRSAAGIQALCGG